jgi:UDP-glucose 4-epimerase
MSQTVLVTGGCGYIGSHVTRQLSEKGYRVIVIDNLSTGFKDSLLNDETLVVCDLGDKAAVDKVFETYRPEAVLHFAASIVVPDSVSDPLSYYRNNTVNTLSLLESCKSYQVGKIIFSSTAAVYGDGYDYPVHEQLDTRPTNPYGWSKLMDEQIIRDLAYASDLRYAIIRYFNVAGADLEARIGQKTPNATHLIKVATQVALGQRPYLNVFGQDYATKDGTAIRDYIHVEDLAAAHVLALEHLNNGGLSDTFNCGYGQGYSVNEVIAALKRISGIDFLVRQGERRAGDVALLVANSSRIRDVLGWTPRYQSLDTIVETAWQWEQRLLSQTNAGLAVSVS